MIMPYSTIVRWMLLTGIASFCQGRILSTSKESINVASVKSSKRCSIVKTPNQGELGVICEDLGSLQNIQSSLVEEDLSQVTVLTIKNSNLTVLNLDYLVTFPSLNTIMINSSRISNWDKPRLEESLPNVTKLVLSQCINNDDLSDYSSRKPTLAVQRQMFFGLPALEELHFSKCLISILDRSAVEIEGLQKVYFSDGGIPCQNFSSIWLMDWIDSGRAFVSDSAECAVPVSKGEVLSMAMYFSFNGHTFVKCMNFKKDVDRDCPEMCQCEVKGMNVDGLPIVTVMCDGRGLTKIPEDIPPLTTKLNLSMNNITDVNSLFTNPNYCHISRLELNSNRIQSIDGELLYNYLKGRPLDVMFSFTNNNLTTFPVKEMAQLFREGKKSNMKYLPYFLLDHNPYNCDDCSFLPEFQEIVYQLSYTKPPFLPDIAGHNVRCSLDSHQGAGLKVIALDVNTLCAVEPPLLMAIDFVNIALGIVLLVLIGNFLYNFYQYRKHGKLPWIITKLSF